MDPYASIFRTNLLVENGGYLFYVYLSAPFDLCATMVGTHLLLGTFQTVCIHLYLSPHPQTISPISQSTVAEVKPLRLLYRRASNIYLNTKY